MDPKENLILIVDDVPKNLQVLGGILGREDYQIAAAINGKQALMLMENLSPDLILLDIMMPEVDGYEVCRRLRQSKRTREIPIIFLTAKTETEDIVKGFECGAVDYVLKPFNAIELLARVKTHLELKKARDSLKELIRKLTERTEALSAANHQLRERQNLIVNLLGDISRIRFSGDRHAIRNLCQRIFENEKNSAVEAMAGQIAAFFRLIGDREPFRSDFQLICEPFGIEKEMAEDREKTEGILHRVIIEKKQPEPDGSGADGLEDDLFGDIFSDEIYLDEAYEEVIVRKKRLAKTEVHFADFDPFLPFFSLRAIQDIVSEVNVRFSHYGQIGFLDQVRLSKAVSDAKKQAVKEKETPLKVKADFSYDPTFSTNEGSLVYMIRDLFYNALDAGADQVRILSKRPSLEEELPHFQRWTFEEYPSLYIRIEDNGGGISARKAEQLNAYFDGEELNPSSLSDKGKKKGGLGTKNLRDFLFLHKGRCRYETGNDGTVIHFYFERLEI